MVSVVLVSVAVIPALYLILQVRKYDRREKEPVGLIVSIVILGMLSTFIAMFLELVLEFLLAYFVSYYSPLYNIILSAKSRTIKRKSRKSQNFLLI